MVPKTPLVEATDATAPLSSRDQQVAIPDGKNVIERLIHQYHGDVYRYGFRLSGNAADADDLAQQVFLAAHQKIDQLREMERARGWLLAITRNQFFKMYRRRRPVDSSSLELDVNQVPDDLEKEEFDQERLQAALDEMPEPYRTVLLMFYFEDLSYQEIADTMQVAIGTVMSRLSRAKGQLRYKLLCPETKDISPAGREG
ncbi:MAG: sigma-70 family RNA polymerase sigma factor [Pirellulaceae bacterium]